MSYPASGYSKLLSQLTCQGGSFALESVAAFVWNGWQPCSGISGRLGVEYACQHISTRQYARIVNRWVESIGLDPPKYGTHSLRRTKAALIYKKTGNLRAVQLLLGHTKLDYLPRKTMSRHTCAS